ncbi:MAG: hypothetical protein AAGA60_27645 [Cyanobacteria bacterium P01_E01_bin.42]
MFSYGNGIDDTSVSPLGNINSIRCLRTAEWKYAVYYGSENSLGETIISPNLQYELYNLQDDPDELTNLLPVGGIATSEAKTEQKQLHQMLTEKLQQTHTIPVNWLATVPN